MHLCRTPEIVELCDLLAHIYEVKLHIYCPGDGILSVASQVIFKSA